MPEEPIENMDRILLTDLRCECIIGCNSWERTKKQEVIINITLYADLSRPSLSDDINDTIDYKDMKKQVVDMVEKSSFKLIEALAGAIIRICLSHKSVNAAMVRVNKPGALRYSRTVGVEIFRTKQDVTQAE
ncbi:MAG: dihydroneopterin aldolase [Sedimentisphaerales bacterium]